MSTIETTPEINSTASNFGAEVAKSFTIALASSAGSLVGFIALGILVNKAQKIQASRTDKKNPNKAE